MTRSDDLWEQLAPVLDGGEGFVLATVLSTSSSVPRPAGTQMAVLADGTVIGSLSGGCIESDVLARADKVAATGQPQVQDYGYSDATAFSVGLTCGGSIRVHLEFVAVHEFGFFRRLLEHLRADRPVATVTKLAGGSRRLLVPDNAPATGGAAAEADELLRQGRSATIHDGWFVRSFTAPEHMVIFGSNAFAAALARLAKTSGYRVTVCDARATFTTRERFPDADEIVVRPPHRYLAELEVEENTVLCAMTHDPKFDDPLLDEALRSPAQFIGAMGSRLTTDERRRRLRERGFGDDDLARLRAPFGLDIGGSTPEEAAVSMLAEVISARRGGSNKPLSDTDGSIHQSR